MKKVFIFLLALTAAIGSFARTNSGTEDASKKITAAQPITSLVINGDISVVLLNGTSKEITIEGSAAAVKNFVVTQTNGAVTISDFSGQKRTVAIVYVPARLINKISLNGAAAVSSYESLYNKNIDVVINGDCKLWLKTYGSVTVDAINEFDYTYSTKAIQE